MNDTNQRQQQNTHPQVIAAAAYVNRHDSNLIPSALQPIRNLPANEEEQIVTSTSNDTFSSPAHHCQRQLDTITSPARITSSTGNDCSSSPPQRVTNKIELLATDVSSEDDSQSSSPSQLQIFPRAVLDVRADEAKSRQEEVGELNRSHLDGAMPTTSAAAATIGLSTTAIAATDAPVHCPKAATPTTTTTKSNTSINNIRNGSLQLANMVAREQLPGGGAVSNSSGAASSSSSSSSSSNTVSSADGAATSSATAAAANSNENHKIIIKIPKSTAHDESHDGADMEPASSSSCSNSSSNSCSAEDTRKVEPLKINLHHHAHHHHHHHHNQGVVPKITIKPIVKKPVETASDCSSSAEDDVVASTDNPVLKLTIKSSAPTSEPSNSEPHVVPKLTIRSANEEGGAAHTTIVPKLTIKMSDNTQSSCGSNNLHSPALNSQKSPSCPTTSSASSSKAEGGSPPPLPKLTIKTSVDGTSESIISTVSPASSTSSTSSSSASIMAVANTASSLTSIVSPGAVPKLTIKTVQKSEEIVPKLTIKTNAARTCVSTSEEVEGIEDVASGSKIPKLTIKTGQEHAVIITQHDTSNTQAIPKLTIKTKSLDAEEALSDPNEDPPPEKIPKITIKTNECPAEVPKFCIKTQQQREMDVDAIPKLTISVTNVEGIGSSATPQSPKQSPFLVRQMATSSHKTASPERVPKLMISRQDAAIVNHCEVVGEKVVPKLTIKTNSVDVSDMKDKSTKFAIKNSTFSSSYDDDKIPKLTIKPLPPKPSQPQSSEESDEGMSVDSLPSPVPPADNCNRVPKLTIKNLLKKMNDGSHTTSETASKKCLKSSEAKSGAPNVTSGQNASLDVNLSNIAARSTNDKVKAPSNTAVSESIANGGESSNSQEFCGFNDNTSESIIETAMAEEMPEEPRRHSDDMDIDEGLQEHAPQVFNNVSHFSASNGKSDNAFVKSLHDQAGVIRHPQSANVIDTVDLTSSPSPGSSPAHFIYSDADPQIPIEQLPHQSAVPAALLMERLQREAVAASPLHIMPDFLRSQLTSSLNGPPPLQPKPPEQHNAHIISNSLKYPQLAERLLANGAHVSFNSAQSARELKETSKHETVIDSIEILDSAESSRQSMMDDELFMQNSNHVNDEDNSAEVLRRNNNTMDAGSHHSSGNHEHLKRRANDSNAAFLEPNCMDLSAVKLRRIENEGHTMATLTILTDDKSSSHATLITTSPTIMANVKCADIRKEIDIAQELIKSQATAAITHRSRKQRHENLRNVPVEEEDPLMFVAGNSNDGIHVTSSTAINCVAAVVEEDKEVVEVEVQTPVNKRRGRPKKTPKVVVPAPPDIADTASNDANASGVFGEHTPLDRSSKTRRVQLLHKRLAIDMVDSEPPVAVLEDKEAPEEEVDTSRTLRNPTRTSRRSATPNVLVPEKTPAAKGAASATKQQRKRGAPSSSSVNVVDTMPALNHFGGSNSSLSSICSTSSLSSGTVITTVAALTASTAGGSSNIQMTTQIDLTMSSSSSSASNGSTTATVTTVGAGMSRGNSMLPPTTILSSSDPLPDLIFKPNDFSSLMATQQLRSAVVSVVRCDSQDEDANGTGGSGADNSGDDSAGSTSNTSTPGRGRGRGRGRSPRGTPGSGRGTRGHRLGRGASAVAKAIAMNRPRCVGGLKHTPDPQRLKGLFSPSPQVFEEDTRMSADMYQIPPPDPPAPLRQPDFITNEESQSSMMSNTSILDPNTVVAVQNGSAVKRTKKKKMEVCVAEDTECTVGSIAEYDWPPPKGCCPSKNRDTFMIQEQVTLYLGIKSFKRKYPDLPRRQIDMEERNWLQEKGLVGEKMCDLGITAVWASDILDIMYADFYDKYEEYKDFIRQKHIREIETKQKALGLNVTGRGLQARDRAMLSTSKWNAYFNRSRKEERISCLDLQTLTVNLPLPATTPGATLVNRPIADAVASAAQAASIPEPPTLLKPHVGERPPRLEVSYPLSLVPGQFCAQYRHYTPMELRAFPLNTLLEDPSTLHLRASRLAAIESESDTESARETEPSATVDSVDDKANLLRNVTGSLDKRFPVRRSRRARGNGIADRTKTKCDTEAVPQEEDKKNELLSKAALPAATATTGSSSSSSSDDSSSETDSDTDSSCSGSSSCCSSDDNAIPATCGVCQRTQNRNLKDLPEVFVKCYTCRRKVHPSCIEMPHRMVARVQNYNWQCADCKCCIKCKRKQDQNKMLFCEQCDRGYHIYCLGIKAVPDGRWSCERCSICMRCGATKPEGLPQQQQLLISPSGEKIKQIKHKKVKWINEYRIDHITKLREHCSMLCVPCARAKTTKRVQIINNAIAANSLMSPPLHQHQQQQQQSLQHAQQLQTLKTSNTQMSPPAAPLTPAHILTSSTIVSPLSTVTSSLTTTTTATTASSAAAGTPPPPPVVA